MREFVLLTTLATALASGIAQADEPVVIERDLLKKAVERIPAERRINTEQFKGIYDEVMAGKRKAYLIDTRSHPEFYAGHIEGTDHVAAGHLRKLTEIIKDPNAEIILWCRTNPRAYYGAVFLHDCGYKNVYVWHEGVVGWIKQGHPLVNQFMGRFKVTGYNKSLKELDKDGRPLWRIRLFHPY